MMHVIGVKGKVFVSGDDVFGWTNRPLTDNDLDVITSKNREGLFALGQLRKDFIVGEPEKHTFLSKQIVMMNDQLDFYRPVPKIAKSGKHSTKLDKMPLY